MTIRVKTSCSRVLKQAGHSKKTARLIILASSSYQDMIGVIWPIWLVGQIHHPLSLNLHFAMSQRLLKLSQANVIKPSNLVVPWIKSGDVSPLAILKEGFSWNYMECPKILWFNLHLNHPTNLFSSLHSQKLTDNPFQNEPTSMSPFTSPDFHLSIEILGLTTPLNTWQSTLDPSRSTTSNLSMFQGIPCETDVKRTKGKSNL